MLSSHSIVTAIRDQIYSRLGDEVVILSLKDGVYYGLDPVGARIWEIIQRPIAVKELKDRLLEEYAVDAERCEEDLLVLLQELRACGLAEVVSDTR